MKIISYIFTLTFLKAFFYILKVPNLLGLKSYYIAPLCYQMSFIPAPLCWDDRDSSLFADLSVTLSTLQPKAHIQH